MIGQRFTRLVVVAKVKSSPGRRGMFLCRCDCGRTREVRASGLRNGSSKSCGCWTSDRLKMANYKHGAAVNHRPSSEWITWRSMHQRCEDPRHKSYASYGGRGITVAPEWRTFEQFLSDMGEKPAGMQLERVDNEKGYSKENCTWATRSAQAKNRRERQRLRDGTFAPKEAAA